MPKIAVYKFLTFFIVSFDTLKEPYHLHISKSKGSRVRAAKIWIESLQFAESGDFSQTELNLIEKLVKKNQVILIKAFDDAKAGKKVNPIKLTL